MLLVFVHLRRVGLGEGEKILNKNHHVLGRRERESSVRSSRRWHGVRRTNKGKFRAVSDSLCCGTVHLTLTHTHQRTQGARYVAEVRILDRSSHISATTGFFHPALTTLRTQCPTFPTFSGGLQSCVTCLNLKYPLMFLQVARSMFLEMRREPLAMATSHPREMSLS